MDVFLKATDVSKIETDALCVFVGEGELTTLSSLNEKLSGSLLSVAKKEGFTGKKDQKISLFTHSKIPAYKVFLVGLGKKEDLDASNLQNIIASTVSDVKKIKAETCTISFPFSQLKKFSGTQAVQTVVEAILLSAYEFEKYKSKKEDEMPKLSHAFIAVSPRDVATAEEGIKRGKLFANATLFARDLVNEPSHVCTPSHLAKIAQTLAKNHKQIHVKILEKDECEKLGMNSYLGVAKGSVESPKYIHLTYTPKRSKGKIALVGKGITFDTGGVSLKPPEHMETMKLDMAGAASVLGVFDVLSELNIPYTVTGIIASCENMPSGSAIKPGDVVTALNGKTIEVLNTDAEGRLTLADAFSYCVKFVKPDYMIDLATLTGACMVALGDDIAGLWSNSDKLKNALIAAGNETGEKIWHMPLEESYKERIKSHVADVKNIQTGRYGGAVTAALFLEEFVGGTAWAHLDIAGPSFAEKPTALHPVGGTGFGVRLLLNLLGGL